MHLKAGKMVLWIKAFAANHDNPRLMPREGGYWKLSSDLHRSAG